MSWEELTAMIEEAIDSTPGLREAVAEAHARGEEVVAVVGMGHDGPAPARKDMN